MQRHLSDTLSDYSHDVGPGGFLFPAFFNEGLFLPDCDDHSFNSLSPSPSDAGHSFTKSAVCLLAGLTTLDVSITIFLNRGNIFLHDRTSCMCCRALLSGYQGRLAERRRFRHSATAFSKRTVLACHPQGNCVRDRNQFRNKESRRRL